MAGRYRSKSEIVFVVVSLFLKKFKKAFLHFLVIPNKELDLAFSRIKDFLANVKKEPDTLQFPISGI